VAKTGKKGRNPKIDVVVLTTKKKKHGKGLIVTARKKSKREEERGKSGHRCAGNRQKHRKSINSSGEFREGVVPRG